MAKRKYYKTVKQKYRLLAKHIIEHGGFVLPNPAKNKAVLYGLVNGSFISIRLSYINSYAAIEEKQQIEAAGGHYIASDKLDLALQAIDDLLKQNKEV